MRLFFNNIVGDKFLSGLSQVCYWGVIKVEEEGNGGRKQGCVMR